jgi:hypothetical protein
MNAAFVAISRDPRIIPGVHHYCDEWCGYCPVTGRCLSHRCTEAFRQDLGRQAHEETFSSMEEAVQFTRDVAAVEGVRTDELDELLGHPPGESGVRTDDPLARRALEYAVHAEAIFLPIALQLAARPVVTSPSGPTPEEVVVWYHLRIYMKIFQALVSHESVCDHQKRRVETLGCAKLALVSIARSRGALDALRGRLRAGHADTLSAMLDELERGLDAKFPGARDYVRVGLDCPVAG